LNYIQNDLKFIGNEGDTEDENAVDIDAFEENIGKVAEGGYAQEKIINNQ
jgi:hypothetical protein